MKIQEKETNKSIAKQNLSPLFYFISLTLVVTKNRVQDVIRLKRCYSTVHSVHSIGLLFTCSEKKVSHSITKKVC